MGFECSQPPDGVAETKFPCRSTTSMWHVSPRRPEALGSPMLPNPSLDGTACLWGRIGSSPAGDPGRSSCEACREISALRLAAYSWLKSAANGTPASSRTRLRGQQTRVLRPRPPGEYAPRKEK